MKEILRRQDSRSFLTKVSPASLACVSAVCSHRALVHDSRMISTHMGSTRDQKWPQRLVRLVRYHPVTVVNM
jgi:hypothetical protein